MRLKPVGLVGEQGLTRAGTASCPPCQPRRGRRRAAGGREQVMRDEVAVNSVSELDDEGEQVQMPEIDF